MKLVTWNINGIRASKIPLKELFDGLGAEIICLQETKVTRDMLDERTAIIEGYSSYYSFSNVKTGYSGVATYVRDKATPTKAEAGLSGVLTGEDSTSVGFYGDHSDFTEEELDALDNEGRSMITQHKIRNTEGKEVNLAIINVYCPRADPEREDRKVYKIRFYELLQQRAHALLTAGFHVIILGDVNTSHKRIDHCDPDDQAEFVKNPGRQWLEQFLWVPSQDPTQELNNEKEGQKQKSAISNHPPRSTQGTETNLSQNLFVDTFRYFYPDRQQAFTCWNTMKGARETNYGTRIDYIFADKTFALEAFSHCDIMPEVIGSDHCPVKGTIKWSMIPSTKLPTLCTKNFPEFAGKQTKLSVFFSKGNKRALPESPNNPTSISDKELPIQTTLQSVRTLPPPSKKLKLEKQSSVKKQSSLANFLSYTVKKPLNNDLNKEIEHPTPIKSSILPQEEPSLQSKASVANDPPMVKPKTVNAWKNLLKGPPPAPLCKGHKEPCLLRTVKKDDSLNKGRQFYVCCKPEGHKFNPDARCDHFEWVDKKKKSST